MAGRRKAPQAQREALERDEAPGPVAGPANEPKREAFLEAPSTYPAHVYNRESKSRIVRNEAGFRALGPGWSANPRFCTSGPRAVDPRMVERQRIEEQERAFDVELPDGGRAAVVRDGEAVPTRMGSSVNVRDSRQKR